MKVSFVFFAGLALAALPAAAQVQVQTTQIGPTPGATAPGTGAPAPQPTPLPCPGMAGLEIGQTRTFSFERMALHEPAKKTVTRDLKIVHTPEGRHVDGRRDVCLRRARRESRGAALPPRPALGPL